MRGLLLVSISSIFDDTRKAAAQLLNSLDRDGVPVALLVAPHIDSNWHLAKDPTTKNWLEEQREEGRLLILNGFDQPVQGRRAEFANLDAHEANLRLRGATRQMNSLGFDFDIFAPPRWRMSEGTLAVLPYFNFSAAVSSTGIYDLNADDFHPARNLSFGEGFGAAKWWRRSIIRAAERGASRGNIVRLSVSGRNLSDKKVRSDFLRAIDKAVESGATPKNYKDLLQPTK
ncbi:MAG: DUF2334 domain-containing protein [Corynebacterium sp.]|nr:DUF2334 domain-containing protein [Corynebacterium sp.]